MELFKALNSAGCVNDTIATLLSIDIECIKLFADTYADLMDFFLY